MAPKTNPIDNRQQNHLQIPESFYFEIYFGKITNAAVEVQQQFFGIFSSEEAQTENECLRLQPQQRIGAAKHLLRKQELDRKHLNQLDIEIQHDNIPSVKAQLLIQHQKRHQHNKLQDLNFFLHHSFFMSLQKDKNEHLLRILRPSLESSFIVQQTLFHLKNTVRIFVQSL